MSTTTIPNAPPADRARARVRLAERPVGEVLNRRLAAFRRHLVGLP